MCGSQPKQKPMLRPNALIVGAADGHQEPTADGGKPVVLQIAETGETKPLTVIPGALTMDAPRAAGLPEGTQIFRLDGTMLGPKDNLYAAVQPGETILAATAMVAGGFFQDLKDVLSREVTWGNSAPPASWVEAHQQTRSLMSQAQQLLADSDHLVRGRVTNRRDFLTASQGGKPRVLLRQRATPAPGTLLVHREERSLAELLGWKEQDNTFTGFYRTVHCACLGRITKFFDGLLDVFIHHPPEQMHCHPHWACFSCHDDGWYSIHFTDPDIAQVGSAILAVQRMLNEAFGD